MFKIRTDLVRVHFIGIGGIGMSGIAEILLNLGHEVSGSDLNESDTTEKLKKLGCNVFKGHAASNIEGVTLVVMSSAISQENPELVAAHDQKIPVMRRAEMLAEIMRMKVGVAVAGTHGKTTTTSILATILKESGFDPTYAIGGVVHNLLGHAHLGKGDVFLAEADESDGSFLLLNPIASVITNIDDDHMDHYGTPEKLVESFEQFSNQIPFYGICALNAHDDRVRNLTSIMRRPYCLFGIAESYKGDLDYAANNVSLSPDSSSFTLLHKGKEVCDIKISIPGRHNILNALGAISLAHYLGADFENIKKSICAFKGVGRRFQKVCQKGKISVYDDYAHHPTEIECTLKTAQEAFDGHKIIVVFEPHRYSRTRDCWENFLHCFNEADSVYMAPIYPASEEPIVGINSETLTKDVNKLHPGLVTELDSITNLKKLIDGLPDELTVVLCLGAGTIGKEVKKLGSA